MMNKTSKTHDSLLRPGVTILGKWHQNRYVIIRQLGKGAIGSVYLCDANGKKAALKISDKGASMTMEVNVLKSLAKVQGKSLGPSLLDVDDWVTPQGTTFSFYVMEYIRGTSLQAFIKQNGREWIGVFLLQLLSDLEELHEAGWVFGDLKEENLLVSSSPTKVRWIDVGGTTLIGRAIKEYTEFYDRGYWGLGTRKAEPSYDLFALTMVFLSIFYPNKFTKGKNPQVTLLRRLQDVRALEPYRDCLKKAILGKYLTSTEMKQEISMAIHQEQQKHIKANTTRTNKQQHKPLALEVVGFLLVALGYYLSSLLIP
ncbi:putative serine/threonine-protein kinase YabT [Ornithinibacillus bavariensis]|uniref:Serine/threonine-protein kinase YabT n=2 Tax=Ornithinibacillus bavariensis TaxID=545502 RepID=A0A920C7Y5_9BACI|nr:protein kinase [Ornithinibacillus bavariensis]GIO28138.1 putative serine/threonine-protein kinase YabT [Ornithinibacillus bavariensis]